MLNTKKSNLPEIMRNNCQHLSPEERTQLLEILLEFEDLFDGSLGDWNTKPVSFQLKEGSQPYHGRAFPIPQVHKETIMKMIKRES